MPAIITSSGTWSSLDQSNPVSQAPGASTREVLRENYDSPEQQFQPRALDIKQLPNDVDGLQEVMQFVGLFAAGYSVPAGVALARIIKILDGFRNTRGPSEGSATYIP